MNRTAKALAAAIVALPTLGFAQTEGATLETLMADYPDMTATDFEVLDINGDGVLSEDELEELDEYDFDDDEDGMTAGDADTEAATEGE